MKKFVSLLVAMLLLVGMVSAASAQSGNLVQWRARSALFGSPVAP